MWDKYSNETIDTLCRIMRINGAVRSLPDALLPQLISQKKTRSRLRPGLSSSLGTGPRKCSDGIQEGSEEKSDVGVNSTEPFTAVPSRSFGACFAVPLLEEVCIALAAVLILNKNPPNNVEAEWKWPPPPSSAMTQFKRELSLSAIPQGKPPPE